MILNFYQTPLGFTVQQTNLCWEGAQSALIGNADDKRQITGTVCVNNSGKFLLVQLIYLSVTDRCHPKVKFHDSSHITHTSNHWSNEPIVIDYLSNIIFPYLEKKRKDLKLEKNPKALPTFHVFKGQPRSTVNELIRKNDIVVIHVPDKHTNALQTLDILVNNSPKCYLSVSWAIE